MERVKLFLKGVCMGVADVIPGVSGGTLALILGIYTELVNTIRGLHLKWLPAVWRWIRGGFRKEDGRKILEAFEEMNVWFMVILVSGISLAVAAGGMVIPGLMEKYPEVMRALFFGLILASVGIPFRMISIDGWKTRAIVAAGVAIGIASGWAATSPDRMHQAGTNWVEVQTEAGESFETVNRRGLASWPSELIFWADENSDLRDAIRQAYPEMTLERPEGSAAVDPEAIDERSQIYDELEIPEGTSVFVPQPYHWYIFFAGMVMVCAMILPGISGSYILLILGVYFFLLNVLRSVLTAVPAMEVPMVALSFFVIFNLGALIGILSFARVMSYMLREYKAVTIGLLVGLMVGGLRGIWPFRQVVDGVVLNTMPTEVDGTLIAVGIAALVGAAAVTGLSWLGRRKEQIEEEQAPA